MPRLLYFSYVVLDKNGKFYPVRHIYWIKLELLNMKYQDLLGDAMLGF